jgi:hypothetical protein
VTAVSSPKSPHRTRVGWFAALGAAALLATDLTGCSGEAGASAAPARHCLAVSHDVLAQIEVGAMPGKPLALAAGSAVQARKGVFVVAARFPGDKGKFVVGVWTVVALRGVVAPILVADVTASAHTTWTSVEEFPQFGVPLNSPTINAARDCLAG